MEFDAHETKVRANASTCLPPVAGRAITFRRDTGARSGADIFDARTRTNAIPVRGRAEAIAPARRCRVQKRNPASPAGAPDLTRPGRPMLREGGTGLATAPRVARGPRPFHPPLPPLPPPPHPPNPPSASQPPLSICNNPPRPQCSAIPSSAHLEQSRACVRACPVPFPSFSLAQAMAARRGCLPLVVAVLVAAVLCRAEAAVRELKVGYYAETCPEAEGIVRDTMARALAREARSVASVMRLQFHDCFVNVSSLARSPRIYDGFSSGSLLPSFTRWRAARRMQGCDGSVLMDATPTMLGEKDALSNINSLRSFEVVDEIKEALEERCPGVVSCADIVIMAARDAVVLVRALTAFPPLPRMRMPFLLCDAACRFPNFVSACVTTNALTLAINFIWTHNSLSAASLAFAFRHPSKPPHHVTLMAAIHAAPCNHRSGQRAGWHHHHEPPIGRQPGPGKARPEGRAHERLNGTQPAPYRTRCCGRESGDDGNEISALLPFPCSPWCSRRFWVEQGSPYRTGRPNRRPARQATKPREYDATLSLCQGFALFPRRTGGPNWEVRLGREDSLTASQEDSDSIMPSPRANASALIRLFAGLNLNVTDLVALSGSHSIGEARCFSIVFRLYNQSGSGRPDPNMDCAYRRALNALCPKGGDEEVTGGMDATPRAFDNRYFKDLVALRGFLNSDQTLFSDNAKTRRVVKRFSKDQDAFFRAFAEGMVKMGELQNPRKGEIRRNCRVANGVPPSPVTPKEVAPYRVLDF
ncbi:hypothetical protein HU200_037823 [Digitaria exilis]|uniref:Plant heme peroxidase family profile domain-containing protein n=1 Tax=Digitaria exilis TaxID=1010633 RepID=A0A835BPI8_9POAL|nr:hypothetical protein HU200_037823 [Digitaria exilis]